MALADPAIYQACRPVVLGDLPALERARQALAPELNLNIIGRAGPRGATRPAPSTFWPCPG